ncbi:hypothetical protein LZD49_10025 [Dyadobacter sp. CY261]|uniref:hypothetical protein n=1 Tax=Dyadobacter sp. CY261 TaxID=2907203 RepID=UPI001F3AF182|nr:hypothetical protein [Dyadobacter sp. CY261]MCF0070809.1 hypothetical protein [Dyadobacter sp. CY261]
MKANFLLPLLLLFSITCAYAQPKPGKKPSKTIVRPTKPATNKRPSDPQKKKEQGTKIAKPDPTASPSRRVVENTPPKNDRLAPNPESDDNLRRIEEQNKAALAAAGEKATYYRMDRASITVLPILLDVPGLYVHDKESNPVYKPQELFKRMRVKDYRGNVLVSEKHFTNRIGFDTGEMFRTILKDSMNFYSLVNLRPAKAKGESVEAARGGSLINQIQQYMTQNNVATNILNIWTNKSILMDRIMYSRTEADRRERVDPKKLAVFEKLLKKNYVLVLAVVNAEKKVERTENDGTYETFRGHIEGYLYQIDPDGLDFNNFKDKHPLKFITSVSMRNEDIDPRSEEIIELLGGLTIEEFKENVNRFIARDIRSQAQSFYKNKDYACAKNYFEYVQKAKLKDTDAAVLRSLINECSAQIARGNLSQDNTCAINTEAIFEDWEFVQGATNQSLKDLETRIEPLKVKSYISKTSPYIAIEIGKKQGLYTDQRFLVYRKTLDKNGKEGTKRVGTLRAVKVANNTEKAEHKKRYNPFAITFESPKSNTMSASNKKEVTPTKEVELRQPHSKPKADSLAEALNTMSVFKQIDGGHLEPFDLVVQNEDKGYGVQLGYGTRIDVPSYIIGVDFRLATILKSRMPFAGLKAGVNLALPQEDKIYNDVQITKGKTAVWDAYLAREFYLSRFFDIKPFAGLIAYKDASSFMFGSAVYINLVGRNSNLKVKLAPEVAYVVDFPIQYSVNVRFDF